jgi:hypothetical protein
MHIQAVAGSNPVFRCAGIETGSMLLDNSVKELSKGTPMMVATPAIAELPMKSRLLIGFINKNFIL